MASSNEHIVEVRDQQTSPTYDEEDSNYKSEWEKASIFGRLHFTFILPFFKLVRKRKDKPVTLDDLPKLGKTERVEAFDDKLMDNYKKQKKTRPGKKPSIVRAIIHTFKKEIIWQFVFQLGFFGLRLVYGYFLHKLLVSLGDPNQTIAEGFRAAVGLFVCLIISMYSSQQAYFNNYNLVTKTKATVISIIYKKINKVSLYNLNQLSLGKIINIVANDINTFDKFFNIFAMFLMPVVFGGGVGILCSFYGPICLTGFAFIFLTFPLQVKLARISAPSRKEKNRLTDERVKFTNEIIESIRLLKMYAWEMAFKSRVEDIREKEINVLRKLAYTEGAQRVLAFSAISGSSFIIFLSYVLNDNGVLDVALVFSTVFIMQVVAMYGVFIPAIGIAFLVEGRLTFKRIEQLIDLPELKPQARLEPVNDENAVEFKHFSGFWDSDGKNGDTSLVVDDKGELIPIPVLRPSKSIEDAKGVLKQIRMASGNSIELEDKPVQDILEEHNAYNEKEDENKKAILKNHADHFAKACLKEITLNVKENTLTAIVGRVGSGKSTLLLSLTGEMPRLEGSLRFKGKLAYVEQEPIIFSGTLRENITFGMDYDAEFYSQVVRASCLIDDFKGFALGDRTEIGEKGINLSGGQKARVALARALYSRADVYLLDDPLSAVDTKVAKRLYEKAIRTFLKDKTVLLATHQVHFVKDAEQIVVMDTGRVAASGTYDELLAMGITLESVTEEDLQKKPSVHDEDHANHVGTEDDLLQLEEREAQQEITNEAAGKLFGDEDALSGKVTWATYKHFLKTSLTRRKGILLLFLLIGTEVLNIAYGRIIGIWGQGDISNGAALGTAGGLALATYVFFFSKVIVYHQATLRGSKRLHDRMLDVIIRSTVQFFDTNPVGRVLSRFSHDVGIMDRMLPQYLLDILEGNTYLIALLLAVFVINPYVVISGSLTLLGLFLVIRYTTKTVIVARQLELLSRSPLYSFFSLTLTGLTAVRAFGQSENFNKKFTGMVNVFTRANYTFQHTSRFMSMLIDMTSSIGCLCGLIIIIATKNEISSDLIGQSALYLLYLNEQIQYILRQTINVNLFMSSCSRIMSYTNDTKQEPALELPEDQALLKTGWPQQGKIDFDHVYMKYRDNMDYVIRDLSFKVKPGEKIGCVGRTGAGKSSILQILFRMVEIERSRQNDNVELQIDSKEINEVGLHTLRKNLSIIPQAPVIFSGTIRRNLDPFDVKTDQELWDVLEEVNLKDYIDKLDNKLESDMTNANQLFSVGQKQLVCLARAILKKTKVIVLDEATANVDFETDTFIQKKIMEKFSDCTVFTIAHRLSTIANYDRVLVMDKGKLAEFDAPYKLLVEKIGDREISNMDGIFASMVQNTGEKASRHIFEVARKKFFENSDKPISLQEVFSVDL